MLLSPIVDRLIGIAAALPFAWLFYHEIRQSPPTLVGLASFVPGVIFVLAMCTRRSATRVSASPWYWGLSFLVGYWTIVPFILAGPGVRLLPWWITSSLGALSILASTYARLSLGRNIGVVPAQRRLVSTGAYRFARHPIYTAVFLAWLTLIAEGCSLWNLWLVGVGVGLYVIKTLMEEEFLSQDPEYQMYMTRVPYRWVPGVV